MVDGSVGVGFVCVCGGVSGRSVVDGVLYSFGEKET